MFITGSSCPTLTTKVRLDNYEPQKRNVRLVAMTHLQTDVGTVAEVTLSGCDFGNTCIWTGAESSDWHDPRNWISCNNTYPSSMDQVYFPPSTPDVLLSKVPSADKSETVDGRTTYYTAIRRLSD